VAIVEHVRSADASEVGALVELQRRASLVWEEYRDQLIASPDAVEVPVEAFAGDGVRVAVGAEGVVGFSVVLAGADRVRELDGLFVEPAVMGQGVGRVLVADVVARARDDGVERIDVTANPRAVGFYERVGFVADGPVPTRFGPGLRMHLEVPG
jgi:GNAT superfamily N-acetyltransferase